MEIEVINELISYWKASDVDFDINNQSESAELLGNGFVNLPVDFVLFYKYINGTNDYDKEEFIFYKVQNLISLGQKFDLEKSNDLYDIVIFADYMHQSWWYGFRIINKYQYEIGIIPSSQKFKLITKSLTEFIEFYLKDSVMLYNFD